MIRKTLTAAIAVAVIGTSAMIATPSTSQAGGYYGGGPVIVIPTPYF